MVTTNRVSTSYGEQLRRMVDTVYRSTTPVPFDHLAGVICINTQNQSQEVMFERRAPRLVRMSNGLVVRHGKGKGASFARGHATMNVNSALARVATL